MFGFHYVFVNNKYDALISKIKEEGLLSNDPQTFCATWEGYLARNVVYSEFFKNNLDLYSYALINKKFFKIKKRHGAESFNRLLEHFSLGFLYPTFGNEAVQIFKSCFFEKITLKEKEYVIDFIGRKILFPSERNEIDSENNKFLEGSSRMRVRN